MFKLSTFTCICGCNEKMSLNILVTKLNDGSPTVLICYLVNDELLYCGNV